MAKNNGKMPPVAQYKVGEKLNSHGFTFIGTASDGVPIATVTGRLLTDFTPPYRKPEEGSTFPTFKGKGGLGIVGDRYD